MSDSSLVTFVGEKVKKQQEGITKWSTFVDGKNGFLYGIPRVARRVVKFSPVDKSMELIGPDLGDGCDWTNGILAKNGCIYCPPYDYLNNNGRKMLKINTDDDTVVTFDTERGRWPSGALGADNCIYCMPLVGGHFFKYILRVDPYTDKLSYIRVPSSGFVGTVLGKDNCIYGLANSTFPHLAVMRFDPIEPENISYFGNEEEFKHVFYTDGVLGNDGHIYGLNYFGQVLKVDTTARTISSIGERLYQNCLSQPIIGLDQCIYWPPGLMTRTLKFDPATLQPASYVGPVIVKNHLNEANWYGGALASDGVIYCAPAYSRKVLVIDPLRELSFTMKQNVKLYPDELGRLFVQNKKSYSESLFESAVRKFGLARSLRLLDECLPSDDEWVERQSSFDSVPLFVPEASGGRKRKRSYDSVPLFVLAASGGRNVGVGDVPLGVIYHLVRRNVSGLLVS